MLIVVAVDAEVFPIAAILRVIEMVYLLTAGLFPTDDALM